MSEELQVLADYVGVWDASVPATQTTGEINATWVLKDRFVEQTGFLKNADGSISNMTTFLTYDQRRKVYRMISFMSNGMIGEAEATWDPATKTMTQVFRDPEVTTTMTGSFAEPGVEKWNMVATGADGRVLHRMSGINTRRG
jgi:hypothetical protein